MGSLQISIQRRRKMFGGRGAGTEAAQRPIVFLCKVWKMFALFFNYEEAALVASSYLY